MPIKTIDLRLIGVAPSTAPNPKETQTIILEGKVNIDRFDGSDYCSLFLYKHGCDGKKKELHLFKALRFRSHAPRFGWGVNPADKAQSEKVNLQTALALCIELYGSSNGLQVYQKFATKYIEPLPFGVSFVHQLTVEL